jgi:O-6-methylguanine DNA methyltransferase
VGEPRRPFDPNDFYAFKERQRMTATVYAYLDSPVGRLCVESDGEFLTGLHMPGHRHWKGLDASWRQADAPFAAACEQLAEYFAGEREAFDLPFKLAGTPFQQRVWSELVRIPYGATITYAELARRTGNPNASRAVGAANGRNPLSIIVPCHRVIGADGSLTGYGGGMETKRWLLEWERGRSGSAGSTLFDDAEPLSAVRGTRSA